VFCPAKWVLIFLGSAITVLTATECARIACGASLRSGRALWYRILYVLPLVVAAFSLRGVDICLPQLSQLSLPELGNPQVSATLHMGLSHAQRWFVMTGIGGVVAILLAVLTAMAAGRENLERSSAHIVDLAIGLFFCGLGGTLLTGVVLLPEPAKSLPWLALVVALNDSAAYFIGSKVGGPKLAPLISPRKTISGALAGLLAGVLSGALAAWLIALPLFSWQACLIAAAVTLSAQVGDLAKSLLKRRYGVKDSGTILPGHGGVLDRMDGMLSGGAVLFLALLWRQL